MKKILFLLISINLISNQSYAKCYHVENQAFCGQISEVSLSYPPDHDPQNIDVVYDVKSTGFFGNYKEIGLTVPRDKVQYYLDYLSR